ncbi:MAG: hypothetical protein WCR59_03235, partial [Planctomycetota bacterium]
TYHGVFAPAAGIRQWVVPRRVEEEREGERCNHGTAGAAAAVPAMVAANGEDAAFRRRQLQRRLRERLRERLRVPHGGWEAALWSAALSVGVTADAGVRDRRFAVPALLGDAARACGDPRPGLGAQGARCAGAFRGSAGAGSRAARRWLVRSGGAFGDGG